MAFSHHLFELRQSGSERGDCTAPYEVIFELTNKHPTVNQFLKDVISRKRDWGRIKISPNQSYKTVWDLISYHEEVDTLEYRWGEWGKDYDIFVEKYGNQKIKSATADGGWSFMDYVILLEKDSSMIYENSNSDNTIDIPTDFEISIKRARNFVERSYSDRLINKIEYNSIMTILDGAEARKRQQIDRNNNGNTF